MATNERFITIFPVLIVVLFSKGTVTQAASFSGIGDCGGSPARSEVRSISKDGSTVVGYSGLSFDTTFLNGGEAFWWEWSLGIECLGFLGVPAFRHAGSVANASSADGSVLVGASTNSSSDVEAAMWTTEGIGRIGAGDLPGGSTLGIATGVSGDGTIVVGRGKNLANLDRGFRWTEQDGMQDLGDLAGGPSLSGAEAVSRDGAVIVGWSYASSHRQAVRWTDQGMVPLGTFGWSNGPYLYNETEALGASDDGSVIVGRGFTLATPSAQNEALRWTEATGMVGLGWLPFTPGPFFDEPQSVALDTSEDGSVIVGWMRTELGKQAAVWTQGIGWRLVQNILEDDGLDLTSQGWLLQEAVAISSDGRTIAGNGSNPDGRHEGWIALMEVPEPSGDTLRLTALLGAAALAVGARGRVPAAR